MSFRKNFAGLVGLCFFVAMATVAIAGIVSMQKNVPLLVQVPSGHGTGIYVGNGKILTAAHVTGDEKTVTIVVGKQTITVPVLWADKGLDIAMLSVPASTLWQGTEIDCRRMPIGTDVTAIGYLFNMGRIQTWGKVAGETIDLTAPGDPLWPSVTPIGISGGPGMSGGPLFDAQGKLRGIVVGSGGDGIRSIMLVVPSTAICKAIVEHEKNG